MRKLFVPLSTLFVFLIVGCGEDPNENLISKTIGLLNDTAGYCEQMTKTLNDATAQAKKEGKPIDVTKIYEATKLAAEIKEKAQTTKRFTEIPDLQTAKARSEIAKESVTAKQRQQYAEQYKATLQSAMEKLDTAERNLDAALRDADAAATDDVSKSAMEKLHQTLKDARNEFEVLTKRQS